MHLSSDDWALTTHEEVTPGSDSALQPIIRKGRVQIQEAMHRQRIPGLAIALVDDSRVVWSEGLGFTDWDCKTAVTPNTPFSIQSMSKNFTAVAVLLAVQDGLVDLDTPISQYLPGFRIHSFLEEQPQKKITLRLLLSHTAGLAMEAPVGNNYDTTPGTFTEHIASISDTWLRFPVGRRYAYSNLGIDLAGYVVQMRSGMPFQTYVKVKLLDPLEMANTSLDMATIRATSERALGHASISDELPLIPMMPCGGVYATANDLARFLQFQIGLGMAGRKRLLNIALVETMDTPQFPGSTHKGYGLGIAVDSAHGATRLSHGGGGFGFLSAMTWYPQLGLGLAWVSNSSEHDLQNWLSDQILDEIINASPEVCRRRAAQAPAIAGQSPTPDRPQPLSDADLAALIENAALPFDAGTLQRWSQHTGTYGMRIWGTLGEFHTVRIEGQGLFLDTTPVTEVQPGLFFTPDGERLDLRGPTPTWRNIKLEKLDGASSQGEGL